VLNIACYLIVFSLEPMYKPDRGRWAIISIAAVATPSVDDLQLTSVQRGNFEACPGGSKSDFNEGKGVI
jgi:hypothetical protein